MHKELRSLYLDSVTYKDIRNISRNMHTARFSQLLPLPTDIEETHEALGAVPLLTSSIELALLLIRKKSIVIFPCKNNLQFFFLAALMGFTLTGHSDQHRSFSTCYLQFIDSLCANCIFLNQPINIQRPMRMYSAIRYQRLQNLV